MSDTPNAQYYKTLIDQLGSYHELVVFRSRFFSMLEQSLSPADCQSVKDHWKAKAVDPALPIAPKNG